MTCLLHPEDDVLLLWVSLLICQMGALACQHFLQATLWIWEMSLGSPSSQERWEKVLENRSLESVVTAPGSLSRLALVPSGWSLRGPIAT